jgi:hypothetical protein
MTKFVVVSGGVISGIGKGVIGETILCSAPIDIFMPSVVFGRVSCLKLILYKTHDV